MLQLTIKQKIIIHICYRDVFNAPVSKKKLTTWLGVRKNNEELRLFSSIIGELKEEGLIIEKSGYLVLRSKEQVVSIQEKKSILTADIIKKGNRFLNIFGRLPFIKFIGISGSVAADNPTPDKKNHIDLDLFVISADNTLWIIFFVERIITNLIRLFKKGNHFYCFNYVTEESFLEVYNKNFYTASEIVNIIPVFDKGIYQEFIKKNQWFESYYSNDSIVFETAKESKMTLFFNLFQPFNYLCFILFCLIRGLKKGSFKYAFEFVKNFDPTQKCNLKRISNPNGGYQEKIRSRFSELLKLNFEKYYKDEIIEELFPKESAFIFLEDKNNTDLEIAETFKKYA